jgi:CRP-like cAMP-binding protein
MDILPLFKNADEVDTHPAGNTIFDAGERAQHMYVVLEGEVELSRGGRVINTVGPGSLLGELALVGRHLRSARATARTDCRLAVVSERRFLFLVQQTPLFALHVMQVIAERLIRRELNPDQ